ncbi:FluC/FEX family fluoride channel [Thermoactinospora rubra]|uniref:FluC/FEX family fluoride channel n=1 Tax=Thermoactinospora rubra TaxID=1088767 RepID=UPI001F0B5569|nr:CrcB family protein [Thermoactinospora rubra]
MPTSRALAAVAAGGVVGALARHGLTTAFPHPPGAFPWTTLAVNLSGCLLIGVLMTVITEVRPAHPLVRPFLGAGVLGGFTTFSAYVVEALSARSAAVAVAYLGGTLAGALLAVLAGACLVRRIAGRR